MLVKDPEEIKAGLISQGFEVKNVSNVKSQEKAPQHSLCFKKNKINDFMNTI